MVKKKKGGTLAEEKLNVLKSLIGTQAKVSRTLMFSFKEGSEISKISMASPESHGYLLHPISEE